MEEVAKLLWLAVLLMSSEFYLNISCVFVDGEKLAESERPVRDPPVQCVYTSLPLPDQIVHSFVVVQDGTAVLSVVLQRDATVDSTAKRAGL